MLSDHVFSFLGRTFTVTSHEQFIAVVVVVGVATAWMVQQFRRRRVVTLQRSSVTDQLVYEMSRIADALESIANRPADQLIAAANRRAEESRGIPLSLLRKDRPES